VEPVRDVLLGFIALLLFVGLTPQGQNLLQEPGTSTQKGILSNINQDTAGINSDTDQLRNLLTKAQFDNEDFAQEGTLTSVLSSANNQENILSNIENIQNNHSENFFNDATFANGYFSTQSSTVADTQTELGNLFIATHVERDLPAGDSVYYIIETTNVDPAQTRFDVTSSGAVEVSLYEDGERTGGSQGVLVRNAKRTGASQSYNSTFYNTTNASDISSEGVKIQRFLSSSGSGIGGSTGGSVSSGAKFILKKNTTYVFEVENIESSSIDVGLASDFYEKPADEIVS